MFSTIEEKTSQQEQIDEISPLKQLTTEEIHKKIQPFIQKNLHFEFLVDEFRL